MKREFRQENFEDFLKRSADNFRMKAPEKVWENLSKRMSRERRRFAAGLSAFLLFTGLLGYLSISTTKQIQPTRQQNNPVQGTALQGNLVKEKEGIKSETPSVSFLPVAALSKKIQTQVEAPLGNKSSGSLPSFPQAKVEEKIVPTIVDRFTPTIVDDNPAANDGNKGKHEPVTKPSFLLSRNDVPWSIESVVNLYKPKGRRFQTEFHFTPTISYRKLSENKSYLRSTTFLNSPPNYAALYGSVNNMVTHKPDLGFELGVTEKFALTKRITVTAGLQFNVNRYDIKAFSTPYSFAPIALRSSTSARVDSIWTLTNYSNVNSSNTKTNWLQNFSFQVSAPVGVELALAGNEKMQFGIAATVQPTYVLGDRAYLITTNYKSYTQVPWLLRRWNANTAFETFVSYQSGKTKWQVGPQVRYQLLSSFISNYPVKENLFDFGLKIGVSFIK